MDHYIYICKNEKCKEKFKEKRGEEKICPFCGTETSLYKIKIEKYIPSWFMYLFITVLILLVICVAGYVYLQFFSGKPIFTIPVFEK